MKNFKYWTQKDGSKVLIKTMTNNHIINALKMIERNYARKCNNSSLDALGYACSTGGEMASYAAEQESEYLMEEAYNQERISEVYPIYSSLEKELEKRK